VAGVVIQESLARSLSFYIFLLAPAMILMLAFFFLHEKQKFKWRIAAGILITISFVATGGMVSWRYNISHDPKWFGKKYVSGALLRVRLLEDPQEKPGSYKALALVESLVIAGRLERVSGKLFLYFSKDSLNKKRAAGDQLIFRNPINEIKNPGNPGGFDYKNYCFNMGITHQVYLNHTDYLFISHQQLPILQRMLGATTQMVLKSIRDYIPGEKESGLAEALLIGYKNDLDKSLVQSYTNTGVVHVIAISGMHLGLVYWLLVSLFRPFRKIKGIGSIVPWLVIAGLWLFSLLAGAQASVLRSALMFSCIVCGEFFGRKTSIYNTLAVSAFLLVCNNPTCLHDAGFTLSYTAVLSIVLFMKPIYHQLYVKNKLLDAIWKLCAISLAAQVLTTPVSIYQFHQFPVYFLLSNLAAVPISGLIVLGEIFLCAIHAFPVLAILTGKILGMLIHLMNDCVAHVEHLPGALWYGLQISFFQSLLLYGIVFCIFYFLKQNKKTWFWFAGLLTAGFFLLRLLSSHQAASACRIVVYSVPHRSAMELFHGRESIYRGDMILNDSAAQKRFFLDPTRTLYRVARTTYTNEHFFIFYKKKILVLDDRLPSMPEGQKIKIDFLIVTGAFKKDPNDIINNMAPAEVVLDAAVTNSFARRWQKACDDRSIPCRNVTTEGAFVKRLN
jgi:competence protein ComEC